MPKIIKNGISYGVPANLSDLYDTKITNPANGDILQYTVTTGQWENIALSGAFLPTTGGTMTGQIKTSYKESIAMGSFGSSSTTIEDLCEELRYSSGCCGSFSLSTAYTKDNVTVSTGWYNFWWIPHRSGGINGGPNGDNCNYGSLYLSGMTVSGLYMIRYTSSAIAQLKDLYCPNTCYGIYTLNGGQQGPGYFGKNRAGFLMSNATVNSDSHYKNWLYMDNYSGNDVGGATALGLDRNEARAFIMQSDASRSAWNNSAEIFTTKSTVPIANGGTGATTAANARTNLAVPYMYTDSYPTLQQPGGGNSWIKIGTSNTSYGLLPSASGGAGSGHNYIGTSSWYWKFAYIDQIYGYLNGNISGSAASATYATLNYLGSTSGTTAKNFNITTTSTEIVICAVFTAEGATKLLSGIFPVNLLASTFREMWLTGGKSEENGSPSSGALRCLINVKLVSTSGTTKTIQVQGVTANSGATHYTPTWYVYHR